MTYKTVIIVSRMVDATIKEYQPDIEFKIFHTIENLAQYLDRNPIRADIMFVTNDVVTSPATAFSCIKDLCLTNDYLSVDRVIYMTEPEAQELNVLNYLINEYDLSSWEIITGSMSRAFVQEVINGTYRGDTYDIHRKVVMRRPRADYVKEQLKHREALDQKYVADDEDLAFIPDEEEVIMEVEQRVSSLHKLYISGLPSIERDIYTLLAAQYISKTKKVIVIENDPEYHTLTEYVTKAKLDCTMVLIEDIYADIHVALDAIRNAESNFVFIGCIDRIKFNYSYIQTLLYYNLLADLDYMLVECSIDELPHNVPTTIVIPSTIPDVLKVGDIVDKSMLKFCTFVGVDMNYLPEVHVNSGKVISTVLNDILSEADLKCQVITVKSLRLGDTAYDLGSVIGGLYQL